MNKNGYSIQLKRKLDYHYKEFDFSKLIPDPLQFPHRYENIYDREISDFISSIYAYGNLKQIISVLEKIHTIFGSSPYNYIINSSLKKITKDFAEIRHRFFDAKDSIDLILAIKSIFENYGNIKNLFLLYYFAEENSLKDSIHFFSVSLKNMFPKNNEGRRSIEFMFPDPYKGSACKRMNLFLRWMVRKDDLDFGLWHEISSSQLVIPVDTHIYKICTELKLTNQKNVNWKMAEEITNNLKNYDKLDPVKYDFAICHIGMRKLNF
ncbi:MAG: TIGR02757 family protein [Ignavibacteriaceae bacterium]|nr:TIGR02757 family protein [Ignavibacteriaceae bacterium]